MNNKKLNQTEESILIGMQEALSYAKGKLKVKKHSISLPDVDVHEAREKLQLTGFVRKGIKSIYKV